MLRPAWTIVVLTAGCAVASCIETAPPSPLITVQDRFINVTRVLADSGQLTERAEVERLLQTHMTEVKRYSGPETPSKCENSPNSYRFYEIVTFEPDAKFWFKDTPGGRPKMFVPGWLGPGGRVGKPNLSYQVKREVFCSASSSAEPEVSAVLLFSQIPAFSCIEKTDLGRALPQAKFSPGTDGAWTYYYNASSRDTWASFEFIYPPECMLDVRIEQGPRVRRIRAERE